MNKLFWPNSGKKGNVSTLLLTDGAVLLRAYETAWSGFIP